MTVATGGRVVLQKGDEILGVIDDALGKLSRVDAPDVGGFVFKATDGQLYKLENGDLIPTDLATGLPPSLLGANLPIPPTRQIPNWSGSAPNPSGSRNNESQNVGMKTIGIEGGSLVCELGSAPDVLAFFACINEYVTPSIRDKNQDLILDRLYRRYLKRDELDAAAVFLKTTKSIFNEVRTSSISWTEWGVGKDTTRLKLDARTLAETFDHFFESFVLCKESAEVFFESWNEYQPIRILISDTAWLMVEHQRPLSEYDELDGPPFWLEFREPNIDKHT